VQISCGDYLVTSKPEVAAGTLQQATNLLAVLIRKRLHDKKI